MSDRDMSNRVRRTIPIPDDVGMPALSGPSECNLKLLQSSFSILVSASSTDVVLEGPEPEVETVALIIDDLIEAIRRGSAPQERDIRQLISQRHRDELVSPSVSGISVLECKDRIIRPRTPGQRRYIETMSAFTITFGVGPAGTGKTYLAMAEAIAALKRREVARIVLSRPIIEAGESLGFLPGTLTEKVDPYIRPLYDALFDMVGPREGAALLQDGTIEVVPLAFMRGRTLNESFVILDEAQNTTPEQMKMFLTRLGYGSRMVVTGDATQSDLPMRTSGLTQALGLLDGIDGIGICELHASDVVRDPLVSAIICAYEERGL